MNNKQRILAGALLLGSGVVLGTLAINMADNSTSKAQQKQMSPAVQVLQPSEEIAIPAKEDTLAPVELKELPNGGSPSVVNTYAEQMAKKAEVDRLSRHYQEAELKAQEAQRSAQQLQLQQATQNKNLIAGQQDAEKKRQEELKAQAELEKKRQAEFARAEAEKKRLAEQYALAEKKRLAEEAEAKRKAELANNPAELEKKRQAELAKAEAEKKRKAELEKKRQELAEKRKAEAEKRAELEKKRLAERAEAKRKAEEKRQEQQMSKADLEKKRQAELVKREAKNAPNHALWMVQIALADKNNANAIASKLRSKGYRVTTSPTSKGIRVMVGPHKDRNSAENVRNRIAGDGSLNMRSAWVHSWVPLEYRK